MSIYTVIRFQIANNSYVLRDVFVGTQIDVIKYYLIQMSTSDVIIDFKFYTYILSNTYVELFQNPTVLLNGVLLGGLTSISMYTDPIVTTEGTRLYKADADSKFVELHSLTLSANTNYLIKITPKDLISIVIS